MDSTESIINSNTCRVCLKNNEKSISIFEKRNNIVISDMIKTFSKSIISESEVYPQKICLNCLENVVFAFKIKKQCEKSDHSMNQFYNHNVLSSNNMKKDPNEE